VRVLGADGYRDGWVIVALIDGHLERVFTVASLAALRAEHAVIVAVDTPIGETRPGVRRAERAAREFLGENTSSVFTPPPYEVLVEPTHEAACDHAHALTGKRISLQAWNLRHKILDATAEWHRDSTRIREVHPECSFRAMAGEPLTPKKHYRGVWQRLHLLQTAGIDLTELALSIPKGPAADDVVDAAAAAWTADRIARGEARSLPSPPELDADGREVAIWV
jgi:predicted RNase H-like nuclease